MLLFYKSKEHKMKPKIGDLALFISKYLAALHACGAFVSRENRCTQRIAHAYGYDISINFFFNNTALTLKDKQNPHIKETLVLSNPAVQINLAELRELSALSWHIHDDRPELAQCYEHLKTAKERNIKVRNIWVVLLVVGISFGALCRLFGGDFVAMAFTFAATFSGAGLRHLLTLWGIDIRLQYIFLSFYSSAFVAFFGGIWAAYFGEFSMHIAIATSILYLIPGIFFINCVIDILDNHVLVGFSRIVNIAILITCMAIGVYLTLVIFELGALA